MTDRILVPVALHDVTVNIALHRAPEPELHQKLVQLGFWVAGYPDLRVGPIDKLDEAEAACSPENPIWRRELTHDTTSDDILGDALAHARLYRPRVQSATFVGPARLERKTRVEKVADNWVAMGTVTLQVGA